MQSSLIKFIILINIITNIITQKQYILLLSWLKCKKIFEQKRIEGRHLLTFESQKLNYFGKKGGWRINMYSYLSHVWYFFQISSNFLSLISSYPLFKNVFQHTFISVNNRGRAPSKYLNKLAIGFIFLYRKLNNMDGVEQQYSTPQNDSILGFKWIKKITQNIV